MDLLLAALAAKKHRMPPVWGGIAYVLANDGLNSIIHLIDVSSLSKVGEFAYPDKRFWFLRKTSGGMFTVYQDANNIGHIVCIDYYSGAIVRDCQLALVQGEYISDYLVLWGDYLYAFTWIIGNEASTKVYKISPSFQVVGHIVLHRAGYINDAIACMGHMYLAYQLNSYNPETESPNVLYDIDLENFVEIGYITVDPDPYGSYLTKIVFDEINDYFYIGQYDGKLHKVSRVPLEKVDVLTVDAYDIPSIVIIDDLYCGVFSSTLLMIKVDLSTFHVIDTLAVTAEIVYGAIACAAYNERLYALMSNDSAHVLVCIDPATLDIAGDMYVFDWPEGFYAMDLLLM